jgi:hypothetical protein
MTSTEDLLNNIENFKEQYYSENSKNMFFKKSQKLDCAQKICEKYDINELLSQTAYIIPSSGEIFLNYPMFKQYANDNNYNIIIDYVFNLINETIQQYGKYVVHVDLNGFTVSAAERYKELIQIFNKRCIETTTIRYVDYCEKWFIYNPPMLIDMISKIIVPMIHPDILNTLTIYSKKDSPYLLNVALGNLHNNHDIIITHTNK